MDTVDFLYDGTPRTELEGMVFASPLYDIPGSTAARWPAAWPVSAYA